ncbi:MAG: hypothetical protein ACREOF_00485 [Gemmatimonadales bacterium]
MPPREFGRLSHQQGKFRRPRQRRRQPGGMAPEIEVKRERAAASGAHDSAWSRVRRIRNAPSSFGSFGRMQFEVIGPITEQRTIAVGRRIRELGRILRRHGPGSWRKRSGIAWVREPDGTTRLAELHWYEATGVGRREFKIKRYLDIDP